MVKTDRYRLGHTDAELQRLATQARLMNPVTSRFLMAVGWEGMRVLDVGSGVGMLFASLVGPTGEMVGTDLALTAIGAAEQRVRTRGVANVTFRHGDPSYMTFNEPFDAIAGRYVLQFVPDPSAVHGSYGTCGLAG
jgi:ubiquinone/menaquinone biosynthesis C-methylase UbiE